MVWGVVYAKVGVMFALTISFAAAGATVPAIIFALLTALAAFVFYLWRDELNLVASLLAVATKGLRDNPHRPPPRRGAAARRVRVARAARRVHDVREHERRRRRVARLRWRGTRVREFASAASSRRRLLRVGDGGVGSAYLFLAAVSGIWFISAALKTQELFVIGGAICQWYFAPVGTAISPAASSTRGTRSVRRLDLCFGSFVLTMVELARSAAERLRRRTAITSSCASSSRASSACTRSSSTSKFAMLQASITGEAFAKPPPPSPTLSRNFLTAYGTYAFREMILQGASLVIAVGFGCAVALLGVFAATLAANAGLYAGLVGILSGIISLVVMSFFAMIALNVVDAVFLCYAMDKDRQRAQGELHAVLHEVNEKNQPQGGLVRNPGGQYAYGSYA